MDYGLDTSEEICEECGEVSSECECDPLEFMKWMLDCTPPEPLPHGRHIRGKV